MLKPKPFSKPLSYDPTRVQRTRGSVRGVITKGKYLTKSPWSALVPFAKKKKKPHSCVLISESKWRLLSQTNIPYLEWWFIWSTGKHWSLLQYLFEVYVSLTLKFNLETSSKPHLEPDMLFIDSHQSLSLINSLVAFHGSYELSFYLNWARLWCNSSSDIWDVL